MFPRILRRIQQRVQEAEFVVTQHARDEMAQEDLTLYDVQGAILSGEIVERQRDKLTAEWKYIIRGTTVIGDPVEVVVKIGFTGRAIIITVYPVEE